MHSQIKKKFYRFQPSTVEVMAELSKVSNADIKKKLVSASVLSTLNCLHPSSDGKHFQKLTDGVILLHKNAWFKYCLDSWIGKC